MIHPAEIKIKNFFHFGYLKPKTSECFTAEVWLPETMIGVVGFDAYALCDGYAQSNSEQYGAISLNPNIEMRGEHEGYNSYLGKQSRWEFIKYDKMQHCFAESLKREKLFYIQRDSYSLCKGTSDLHKTVMFPANTSIRLPAKTPLYFKVAAINATNHEINYDVIIDVFFVEFY